MPPTKNNFKKYTVDAMKNAIEAVRRGASVSYASKQYGIPRVTLMYKVKGKYDVDCRMGPDTVLKAEEETLLVTWLFTIADAGFPATRLQLLDSVQILMEKLKRPNVFKNNRPGQKWYQCFLRRHPELAERLAQNLTKSRADVSEEKLRKWFEEIQQYLKSKNLENVLEDPSRIFNCDESAFFLAPKGIKCLVKKGDKTVYNVINNNDKECLTCLITANAAGALLPPMIMFNYERIPASIANSMPDGWGIGKSESGWMTGQSFYEFITNIFYPWVTSNNVKFPVILFVDGHSSHLTMELSNFCVENQIELISLYPNATHILQPMDVAVFHPLKNGWKRGVQNYKIQNEGRKIRKESFGPLLKQVIQQTLFPDSELLVDSTTIKNGFKACGLFPFTADGIAYEKYFKDGTCSNTIKAVISTTIRDLNYLEHKIGPEKIKSFKECEGEWEGNIEDTSLFLLWKQISSELSHENEISIESNLIIQPTKVIELPVQKPQNIEDSYQAFVPDVTSKIHLQESTPTKIERPDNEKTLDGEPSTSRIIIHQNLIIPSPFKSSLFWPKLPNNPIKRKLTEKIPSVATSDQWRTYHQKKQEQKAKKEMEKIERKRKRDEAKLEKEKMKSIKAKAKRKNTLHLKLEEEDSSNSSIDVSLQSEGEGDDWDNFSCDSSDFNTNDFVIVKYGADCYPGNLLFIIFLIKCQLVFIL